MCENVPSYVVQWTKTCSKSDDKESTLEFGDFQMKSTIGNPGEGNDLISINKNSRMVAIGFQKGVFICPTFIVHRAFMHQTTSVPNLKIVPSVPSDDGGCAGKVIELRDDPIQVSFNDAGNALAVRTTTGIFFYKVSQTGDRRTDQPKMIKSFGGQYRKFEWMKNGFGFLDSNGTLSVGNYDAGLRFPKNRAISTFSFSPCRSMIALAEGGNIVIYFINDAHLTKKEVYSLGNLTVETMFWQSHDNIFFVCNEWSSDNGNLEKKKKLPCVLRKVKKPNGEIRIECRCHSLDKFHSKTRDATMTKTDGMPIFKFVPEYNATFAISRRSSTLEVFETFKDGISRLNGGNDPKKQLFYQDTCKGFDVDYTFRIPIGNEETIMTPVIYCMNEKGILSFYQLIKRDENGRHIKMKLFENFASLEEKHIYQSQWIAYYHDRKQLTLFRDMTNALFPGSSSIHGYVSVAEPKMMNENEKLEKVERNKKEEKEDLDSDSETEKEEDDEDDGFLGLKKGFFSRQCQKKKKKSKKKNKKKKKFCAVCKKTKAELLVQEGRRLSLCSRCRNVRYCSIECQKKDWKDHKKSCMKKSQEP